MKVNDDEELQALYVRLSGAAITTAALSFLSSPVQGCTDRCGKREFPRHAAEGEPRRGPTSVQQSADSGLCRRSVDGAERRLRFHPQYALASRRPGASWTPITMTDLTG